MTLSETADKIRALMTVDPSQPLNLQQLARAGDKLHGVINIDQMERARDVLRHPAGDLSYCLAFDFDESGRLCVELDMKATVPLVCQRCLQPIQLEIARQSWLALVADKAEMASLPAKYEPLALAEQDEITLIQLLEDELLLAIPFAPLHDEADCSANEELKRIQAEGKINPFAELAKLKKPGN